MSFSTPWGQTDYQKKLAAGVYLVETPGHGGILVERITAAMTLSQAARDFGEEYAGFYCYEEDCDWAIPAYEHADWFVGVYLRLQTAAEIRQAAYEVLATCNLPYLRARGQTPDSHYEGPHVHEIRGLDREIDAFYLRAAHMGNPRMTDDEIQQEARRHLARALMLFAREQHCVATTGKPDDLNSLLPDIVTALLDAVSHPADVRQIEWHDAKRLTHSADNSPQGETLRTLQRLQRVLNPTDAYEVSLW